MKSTRLDGKRFRCLLTLSFTMVVGGENESLVSEKVPFSALEILEEHDLDDPIASIEVSLSNVTAATEFLLEDRGQFVTKETCRHIIRTFDKRNISSFMWGDNTANPIDTILYDDLQISIYSELLRDLANRWDINQLSITVKDYAFQQIVQDIMPDCSEDLSSNINKILEAHLSMQIVMRLVKPDEGIFSANKRTIETYCRLANKAVGETFSSGEKPITEASILQATLRVFAESGFDTSEFATKGHAVILDASNKDLISYDGDWVSNVTKYLFGDNSKTICLDTVDAALEPSQ